MLTSKNNELDKLTVAECKKILSKGGKHYSEGEIISIRDFLYCLAQIEVSIIRRDEKAKSKEQSSDTTEFEQAA